MIDTHCHLTDPRLLDQLEDVLSRAAQAGVRRLITIGTDLDDSRQSVALCAGRDNLRCVVGIHPNYSHNARGEDVEALRELQSHPSVVALGEMGLDYFHKFADRSVQRRFFERQLALADDLDRPVVIHCREAVDDTLAILAGFPRVRCVFHCFTGTPDEARRITSRGYLLGFTGPVTYKKNDQLRLAALECPIDQILIETDAPYLSPEPVRSIKTNEPAFVTHVARRIAEIRGMSPEAFDETIHRNAKRFFGFG